MNLKYISSLITIASLSIQAQSALAQFEPNLVNQNSTVNPSNIFNPNDSSTIYPSLPLGDINQQGGIINNNGGLGQQNSCGRACINFYTDFSRNDSRFGVNLSIPLFAPENELTSAQSKRTLYDVESGYIKAISDACQAKDIVKAELSAKGLARIWNVDYKTLFRPSCG